MGLGHVQSQGTVPRSTRTVQSWGNRQVVDGVPGAESHEFKSQHHAVREKPDQNCSSGKQSYGRSHQVAEDLGGVVSTGIQSDCAVQAPIFG